MVAALSFVFPTPEETMDFGRALGRVLRAGDLVLLAGPLGRPIPVPGAGEQARQLRRIDGLDRVAVEARLVGELTIFLLAVAGHGDDQGVG